MKGEHTMNNSPTYPSGICRFRAVPQLTRVLDVLCILIGLLMPTGLTVAGEDDAYHYKLIVNHDNAVCTHMAHVYKRYFRRPFQYTRDKHEYVKNGGVLPELLPGGNDDSSTFFRIASSLQPTSPEFNAIDWKLGALILPGASDMPQPFLAANIDLFNNGQLETLIKSLFMACYKPGCAYGHGDELSIFRYGVINFETAPLKEQTVLNGEDGRRPLALDGEYSHPRCNLTRPFIYGGKIYISCYRQTWIKDYMNMNNNTPDFEYMDVLRYMGIAKLQNGQGKIRKQTLCQFRMTVFK